MERNTQIVIVKMKDVANTHKSFGISFTQIISSSPQFQNQELHLSITEKNQEQPYLEGQPKKYPDESMREGENLRKRGDDKTAERRLQPQKYFTSGSQNNRKFTG